MNHYIEKLISKYLERTITVDEFKELNNWVLSSEENKDLFGDILSVYKLSVVADYSERDINELIELNISQIKSRRRKKLLFRLSAAAAVFALIMASVTILLLSQENNQADNKEYLTSDYIENKNVGKVLESDGQDIILNESGENIPVTHGMDKQLINGVSLTESSIDYTALSKMAESLSSDIISSVSVPKGKNFKITLSDGTKMWVNSDSYVQYPSVFSGDVRKINVRGEVYLEVAHNPQKPFVVEVYNSEIKVLGTKFNVSAYPESVNTVTTLLEGSVIVDDTNILSPDEQLSLNKHTMKGSINKVDASMSMQWINGIYYFDNMTLSDLSVLFNRVYDVNISINSEKSMKKMFTGSIHKDIPFKEMFEIIMQTTKIEYVIDKEKITIW